jgi:hypothetical protein
MVKETCRFESEKADQANVFEVDKKPESKMFSYRSKQRTQHALASWMHAMLESLIGQDS